jgi:hypothetical protein
LAEQQQQHGASVWQVSPPCPVSSIAVAPTELPCDADRAELADSQLRLERPEVVAEVEQLAVVILPERRGNLKADTNNEILPVVRKVLLPGPRSD